MRKPVRNTNRAVGGLTRGGKRRPGMGGLTTAAKPRPGYGKATTAARPRPRKR